MLYPHGQESDRVQNVLEDVGAWAEHGTIASVCPWPAALWTPPEPFPSLDWNSPTWFQSGDLCDQLLETPERKYRKISRLSSMKDGAFKGIPQNFWQWQDHWKMTHTYTQLHLTQMHTHTPTHAPALPNPLILLYFSHSTGFLQSFICIFSICLYQGISAPWRQGLCYPLLQP